MTITPTRPADGPDSAQSGFRLAAIDMYRDIHKGIRAELFAITSTAGSLDPADEIDRAALGDHVRSVSDLLVMHAHHEDTFLDPVVAAHLPDVAEQINREHDEIDHRLVRIVDLTQSMVDAAAADQRRLIHLLYLDLASFTGAYLAHLDVEERVVMPMLDRILGPGECAALHGAIIGSIPPDEMARSLAFMLPAMNVDDRTEMLAGMRMEAPPEAFDHVLGLARSVLHQPDFAALAARLGVAS